MFSLAYTTCLDLYNHLCLTGQFISPYILFSGEITGTNISSCVVKPGIAGQKK
jgi:hypothetical protein